MALPVITVMEKGRIESAKDFLRLDIVDWKRYKPWSSPQAAMDMLSDFFVSRTSYAILQVDLFAYPRVKKFPEWKHAGIAHHDLGEAFWNFFHAHYEGTLHFHDMPDFDGVVHHKDRYPKDWKVYGDIGKVSPITMREALMELRYYSWWMSAPNEHTVIIVEPLVPITDKDPNTFYWLPLNSDLYGDVILKEAV